MAPVSPTLTSRRVRRNRVLWSLGALAVVALVIGLSQGGGGHAASPTPGPPVTPPPVPAKNPRLDPEWEGSGKPVTFSFGGDVNFPSGSTLGNLLADNPATALGSTVPELLSGADLSMVNFESALTNGTCPDSQDKQYVFYSPSTALQAFMGAKISLITEANNHGEDCGAAGLQMALAARTAANYTVLGIGQNAPQAFAPYRTTINGQKVAIIAATQVIDTNLQTAWTATATQPGLASAYDITDLVATVEAARKTADTVIVYLHWGTQNDACPNPLQEPLAKALVAAGADIIIGTHAHVLLGAGYLGTAYVDYGLGNFAFYDNSYPQNQSGSLVVTATGRHIDQVTWRPAVIVNDLPQPLSGTEADNAIAAWQGDRSCTDVTATPTAPQASASSEQEAPAPSVVTQLSTNS